ncbi:DNA polymerase IV [Sporotomaculum syntrophicum]|uniref:DNA polymerase IV n=1 Tax=Sporotomaculum syntrophicum TaxID=182264 RepID=A0A9D3AVQ9_9FIRM|nr:DNA polymerase IV [Sporotomaculum syntrophicum]KAF1084445.1 DNA polymerase IV [Sporotomaculum syntrophicum]
MHILHIDMDAFYASVEQRDKPELQGKPVVVGGRPEDRGVVATASYEARRYGIKSAMPMAIALKLCPGLTVLPVNHHKYRRVSAAVMEIFRAYTPILEPVSLDEAFLDVRGSEKLFGPAEVIGAVIQKRIQEELQLSASVGVGPNKFIAKLASDYQKPNGFTVISQEKVLQFLAPLRISKMWGIGDKTAASLNHLGIKTIGQLRELPLELLEGKFGKHGRVLYEFARGVDNRPVKPMREVKSLGKEVTFPEDICDLEVLRRTLQELAEKVARRLRRGDLKTGSVTLKIKYPDFQLVTRTESLPEPTDLPGPIYRAAGQLLAKHCKPPVRLLGVTCGKLTGERQITLFRDEQLVKEEKVTAALDKLRDRYGEDVIMAASLLKKPNEHS